LAINETRERNIQKMDDHVTGGRQNMERTEKSWEIECSTPQRRRIRRKEEDYNEAGACGDNGPSRSTRTALKGNSRFIATLQFHDMIMMVVVVVVAVSQTLPRQSKHMPHSYRAHIHIHPTFSHARNLTSTV
jgi:hypothetical protein